LRRLRSHVEVYVFRRRAGRVEFLCLRRAEHRSLPGVWQPVTGKRKPRERAAVAALREVLEETGLVPVRMWGLESVSVYFDSRRDEVEFLPLFAAELPARSRPRLSSEHDAWRFAPAAAAGRLFLWEAQRRGLEAVRREVLARPTLAAALHLDPKALMPRRLGARGPRRVKKK
jgi:8-oxo-dGTP pyrophosphatase MutT (NUDIX family)